MITTTLNRIRAHDPCAEGWQKLLTYLGKTEADDEPLPYATIVASNGIDDALWACCAEPQHVREWRLFAVWCARQVQHLMTDARSIAALDIAERHANGQATDADLAAARDAAWEAARTAERTAERIAEWAAARTAARTAAAARDAAWETAWGTAWAAARTAAAARTDAAARTAAREAEWDDVWDAARAAQRAEFLRTVGG